MAVARPRRGRPVRLRTPRAAIDAGIAFSSEDRKAEGVVADLSVRDVFDARRWQDQGIVSFNMKAVGVLGVLLVTVVLMTTACIVVPLLRAGRGTSLNRSAAPYLAYFAAIGFGFMLIEIS